MGVFVVAFAVQIPLTPVPPWTTWENLVGNALGSLIVVAAVAGAVNLWPNNRRLHWRRYRRM